MGKRSGTDFKGGRIGCFSKSNLRESHTDGFILGHLSIVYPDLCSIYINFKTLEKKKVKAVSNIVDHVLEHGKTDSKVRQIHYSVHEFLNNVEADTCLSAIAWKAKAGHLIFNAPEVKNEDEKTGRNLLVVLQDIVNRLIQFRLIFQRPDHPFSQFA